MNKILFLSVALLFSGFSYASNDNCNCRLTDYVDDYLEIEQNSQKSDIEIKDLSEEELAYVTKRLCGNIVLSANSGFVPENFKNIIHELLSTSGDITESKKNQIIVAFLNKYKQKLICPKSSAHTKTRDLHIYKTAALEGIIDLYDEILLNDDDFPGVDFNAYEIVNGKKETLVNYIEYLIGTDLYDNDELELLRDDIIEFGGGKRGSEL